MEFLCFCFCAQMQKPLVDDLQRVSIYNQESEASCLELKNSDFLVSACLDGPKTTGWPVVFQGLAPMDQ